jgi:exodeoxyribonuclease-1
MAFIFYDTETTGTDTFFDQVLQFAAILTDDNLNEIERFEVRSRLLPHVVASPGAMNVTGVTAAQLCEPTYSSHYEMTCLISAKLTKWQPAYFVGHNSIEFDEVLLRSMFYKSLHPVYLTNTNGNSRLDSLKMLRSAYLYEDSSIEFPLNEKGAPSFKLDRLAPANGFNHENAHEAMSDVEATVFMCRKVRDEAPDTWSRYMRFAEKSSVLDFCDSEQVIGLTEFYFGKPYTYLLHKIGQHPENGNAILAVDLNMDLEDLTQSTHTELVKLMSKSPKAVRKIKANALPGIIEGEDAHPHSKLNDIDYAHIESRAAQISEDNELKERLLAAYLEAQKEYDPSPHIEEKMYDGFPSAEDNELMERFHTTPWADRHKIVNSLVDERYQLLGEWIIFCESQESLPNDRRDYWEGYVADRLLGRGDACKALTLPDAIQQADDLIGSATGEKLTLLTEHRKRMVDLAQTLGN